MDLNVQRLRKEMELEKEMKLLYNRDSKKDIL